jgi:hypothetical protein
VKKIKTEDILNYLAGGFLRGNIGFIKSNTTERIKGPTTVQREIRIGVTHVRKNQKFSIEIKLSILLDLCRISSESWYIMDRTEFIVIY